jgi:hypothetical protein
VSLGEGVLKGFEFVLSIEVGLDSLVGLVLSGLYVGSGLVLGGGPEGVPPGDVPVVSVGDWALLWVATPKDRPRARDDRSNPLRGNDRKKGDRFMGLNRLKNNISPFTNLTIKSKKLDNL